MFGCGVSLRTGWTISITLCSWVPLISFDPTSYPCTNMEKENPQKDIGLRTVPWGDVKQRKASPYSREAWTRTGHLRAIQLRRGWFDSCRRFLLFLMNSQRHVRPADDSLIGRPFGPAVPRRTFQFSIVSAPTAEPKIIVMTKHVRQGRLLFFGD